MSEAGDTALSDEGFFEKNQISILIVCVGTTLSFLFFTCQYCFKHHPEKLDEFFRKPHDTSHVEFRDEGGLAVQTVPISPKSTKRSSGIHIV